MDLDDLRRRYGDIKVNKALSTSINRAINKARAAIGRDLRQAWGIKNAPIKKAVSVDKSVAATLQGRLIYQAEKGLPLGWFKPKRLAVTTRSDYFFRGPITRFGVTAKVTRGGSHERVRHAMNKTAISAPFLPNKKGAKWPFVRTSDSEHPLKSAVIESIPEMVSDAEVVALFERTAMQALPQEFDHNMRRFLAGPGGRR
jgi:hypothetical protein